MRRALALENLPRVLGLLFARALDGSEWFRSRQVVEMLRPPSPPQGVTDDAAWKPSAPEPVPAEQTPFDDDAARRLAGFERVVKTLRAGGAKVVLVAPPLARLYRVEECTPAQNALRQAVAHRTGAPLLDFTCADVDERWFVDGQHLSSPGRAKYSRALGEAARALP